MSGAVDSVPPPTETVNNELTLKLLLKFGFGLSFVVGVLWFANRGQMMDEKLFKIGMGLSAGGMMLFLVAIYYAALGLTNFSKGFIVLLLLVLLFMASGFIALHLMSHVNKTARISVFVVIYSICLAVILVPVWKVVVQILKSVGTWIVGVIKAGWNFVTITWNNFAAAFMAIFNWAVNSVAAAFAWVIHAPNAVGVWLVNGST